MVYYFTSTACEAPATAAAATLYMGKDKVENEELIRYGWDEDVWFVVLVHRLQCPEFFRLTGFLWGGLGYVELFHADNLSSAHVYLRLEEGQEWNSLPAALVEDCAQLTKANSIEGNKRDNVTIIYTPWSNLKKDGGMAVGQVGFHDNKKTKRLIVPTRSNPIINRLAKTRTEISPAQSTQHLRESRDAHLAGKRKVANEGLQKQKKEEARVARERREEKARGEAEWQALYGDGRVQEEGRGNNDEEGGWKDDDFM